MRRLLAAAVVAGILAGTLAGGQRLLAHHAHTMFDQGRDVTYSGVVVTFLWRNPHVHIIVDVPEGPDVPPELVGRWDIEAASTSIMTRQGWNRATLAEGDAITLVAHPMRDGSKGAELFYVIQEDGSRLYQDIARPADDPAGN